MTNKLNEEKIFNITESLIRHVLLAKVHQATENDENPANNVKNVLLEIVGAGWYTDEMVCKIINNEFPEFKYILDKILVLK